MKLFRLFFLLIPVLIACNQTGSRSFIAANNKNIAYIGRFDLSHKKHPVFMYSGCAIRTVFDGTSVELLMKDDSLRNMFNVIIDDSLFVLTANRKDGIYPLAANLENKKHRLEINRRTEWHGGNTTFKGFNIDKGKKLSKPSVSDRRVEFIGDSYTCGYGVEGKSHDEHFSYETENNYLTYGAVTARALNAEYLTVCRSGIGMWQGYGGNKEFTMPPVYNEIVTTSKKKWDFSSYQPQVVAIDLGGNDLSAELDSSEYIDTYVKFLKKIRKNYASAKIICLAGPSDTGDDWKKWQSYIHQVVDISGKADPSVYYFEFTTFQPSGSDWHPNVEQHKKMAEELVPYIKELMGW